jgi:hypothetical protein
LVRSSVYIDMSTFVSGKATPPDLHG